MCFFCTDPSTLDWYGSSTRYLLLLGQIFFSVFSFPISLRCFHCLCLVLGPPKHHYYGSNYCSIVLSFVSGSLYQFQSSVAIAVSFRCEVTVLVHGLSGKFPNVQNSPPLRLPSGARQVLLFSNEFDELRRENRIGLSCLVIVLCFFM